MPEKSHSLRSPFQTSRTIAGLPVFGLLKQSSDANANPAGIPKDHRSLRQSSATAFLTIARNRQPRAGRELMMRHAVGLSETIESVTEMIEANYVVTYPSQMTLQVMGILQWWSWCGGRLQSHFGRGGLICLSTNTRRCGNYDPRESGQRTWVSSRASRRDTACEQAPWLASMHMCPPP